MNKIDYSSIGVRIPEGYMPGLYDFTGGTLTIQLRKNAYEPLSDSPEEKRCCNRCRLEVGSIGCAFAYTDCPCHKPETTHEKDYVEIDKDTFKDMKLVVNVKVEPDISHEKDFVESALSEFTSGFWWHRIPKNTKQMKDIETFLKEKLTEAIEEGSHQSFDRGLKEGYITGESDGINAGRLAMKEEIAEIVAAKKMCWPDPRLGGVAEYGVRKQNEVVEAVLAAIREMK